MFKSNNVRIFAMQIPTYLKKYIHYFESIKTQADVIDEFTTQLLQKKLDKWEMIRSNRNIKPGPIQSIMVNKIFDKAENININGFKTDEIDDLIMETLEIGDNKRLFTIINQCIEYKNPTSFHIIEKVLSYCARNGLRDLVLTVQKLVKDSYPGEMESNSDFNHYLAEVIWLRGNITDSLKLFGEVYRSNQFLRKRIRLMIKYLITNITSQRSEAALVTVISFTERLGLEYNDYFLLACVWQSCFLSEWYTDQCIAVEILEKHCRLIDAIVIRVPFIIHFALRENQPDTLHRLFEILLKYNLKVHYTRILQTLFSYRYYRNDLRSCAEILQWSLKVNVPLLSIQHEQFISLLLGQQNSKNEELCKILGTPKYQLKF